MGYQPKAPRTWMAKSPPKPFYGPDDYYPDMDVEQAVKDNEADITRWHQQYKRLSWVSKIKLAVGMKVRCP